MKGWPGAGAVALGALVLALFGASLSGLFNLPSLAWQAVLALWVLGGSLALVFFAQGVALVLYGLVNAGAIWAGAWFGPLAWPARGGRPEIAAK